MPCPPTFFYWQGHFSIFYMLFSQFFFFFFLVFIHTDGILTRKERKIKMVAARISYSNTEVFFQLNWSFQTNEKLLAYMPGACVHPSHDSRAHLAAPALVQTFGLASDQTLVLPITVVLPGSCGLWAGQSHCTQYDPAPSLGAQG